MSRSVPRGCRSETRETFVMPTPQSIIPKPLGKVTGAKMVVVMLAMHRNKTHNVEDRSHSLRAASLIELIPKEQ